MKILIKLAVIISFLTCCNSKSQIEQEPLNLPIKITKNLGFTEQGELLSQSIFKNFKSSYKWLKTDKLYSHGRIVLNKSINTLIVTEDPIDTYRGYLYLINFKSELKPLDILRIDDLENTIETEIKQDTIYKLVTYNSSRWVEKYIVSDEGKFILVEEKKVWADTTYEPH